MNPKLKFLPEAGAAICATTTIWLNAFQGNWSTVTWAGIALIWIGTYVRALSAKDEVISLMKSHHETLERWVKDAKLTDAMKMSRIAKALKDEITLQGTEDFILMKNDEVREWWFTKEEE